MKNQLQPLGQKLGLSVVAALLATHSFAGQSNNEEVVLKTQQTTQDIQQQIALARAGEVAIDPKTFTHLVLLRNPDVLLANEQRKMARQQLLFDRGAYVPEFFATLGADDNRYANDPKVENTPPQTIDRNKKFNLGVRKLVRSGAEISVEYDTRRQIQNTESRMAPFGIDDTTGKLAFKVRQPLFRGIGAAQVQGRIEQAQHQIQIANQEVRQQVLSKSFDAITLYWRLYRAEQLRQLNEAALDFSDQAVKDMQAQVQAGRIAASQLTEARSILMLREADAYAAKQTYQQVEASINALLNIENQSAQTLTFRTVDKPDTTPWNGTTDFGSYVDQVLQTWPNYSIAQMRLAIEQINLKMAQDEVRPRLDMVLGYHQNSRRFDNDTDRALKDSFRSHHPGWSVGLEFSTPLGGNTPAKARREMAQIKIHQNQLQLDTVRADLTNQLWLRLEQLKQTYQEMGRYEAHVGYLQELLRVQQERYELGASSFAELIERQDRLNAGLVRLLDVKIRYELARAAVQLTDGTLLDSLGVDIDVEFL